MDVDIAQRLMQRRKQAGYSQEALAEKLGVSRQAVSKWERSESSPDTDNLILLAQLYGISLDDLLFDDPPSQNEGAATAPAADADSTAPDEAPAPDDAPGTAPDDAPDPDASKPKVNIGFDGVHVVDKDDYVHVSWADGVHVKDGKKGEEVHVGWDGVHIKDANTVIDGELGHGPHGKSKGGVNINGEHFDSWKDAHDSYHFDGKTSGKTAFEKSWNRFPFPLLVLIAFFALGGFGVCPWGPLFFLFFTIPAYYVVGSAIGRRSPATFVQGVYPMAALAGFCYAAFILGSPSPAWLLLVSIPLVAILVHSLSKWWRHRKKSR